MMKVRRKGKGGMTVMRKKREGTEGGERERGGNKRNGMNVEG